MSAPVNIPVVSAPGIRVHTLMAWLNLEAPWNMPLAFITRDTFHELIGWLKCSAE